MSLPADPGAAPQGRAFELRGCDAAVAIEWLHVYGEVLGVLEQEDLFVVWTQGPLPKLPEQLAVDVHERVVSPEDYQITGLEQDAVIEVAPDLIVRPPWVERPVEYVGVELLVPRGGAFGSGEHDSTKAALRVLHRVWLSAAGAAPASVADVGTGSGILALYANVRGCARIEACDIDRPSVEAARELLPTANVHVGGAECLQPCDLVVANMTGAELAGSLPEILAIWTGRRELVLSGMRAPEVGGLLDAVPAEVVCRETLGAFTAAALRRRQLAR